MSSTFALNMEQDLGTSFGEPPYVPCTWGGGTDAEIVEALEKHYEGKVDLTQYWSVGDERTVSLSAMSATGVGESHVAQDVTMVLMNVGGKELNTPINGISECVFVVGQKNGLANNTTGETGYMNSTSINTGGWNSCARRTWCNNVYYNAIPSTLRNIFKQHKNITADGASTTTTTSIDYFALPAEKEVFGSVTYANSTAESLLSQFTYYTTSDNRTKKNGNSGSANNWWERSPYSGTNYFCCIFHGQSGSESADYSGAATSRLIAPFGVI